MVPALEEPFGNKDLLVDGADAVSLSSIALPTATIRRVLRSSLPEGRLSAEAVAVFHRIAQVFICWLTNGACRQLADGNKKSKGKAAAIKQPISPELVMRFLHSELPLVADKIANLFPEIVGVEHKPAAVHLLEQLQRRDAGLTTIPDGSEAGPATGLTELLGEVPDAAIDGQEADVQVSTVAKKGKGKRPAEKQSGQKTTAKKAKRGTEAIGTPVVVPKPLSHFFAAGA
mmetsp:Transcript_21792/g.49606  ORF Transcript_21792/g.49606 Transcript_21792/m.49606 type:complete len:230 (-) Transcript_21792:100-789(-)